ncbi:MAG: sigma-70 family RNA polymerase sigma factor [Tissierellaceae bacterium]|nr:sigma-70 family RNA polymerase sigma factor [Tissierellaceae bacterium]
MGEKTLIKNLKKKKEDAYIELVNLYGNKLLKTLYLMIKDEKEAEDIVQETFIRVFKYIDGFKGDSSIYTWIYRIAQNIAKDRLSSRMATVHYEDMEIEPEYVEDTLIGKIDREILREQLNNLKFIYKQVIVLFYFEELSIKEISEILDEKEGTVKSKLSRGRDLLRKALEKGGRFNG